MFGPERTRRLPLTLGVLIAIGCASCDDDGSTETMDDPAVTDPMEEEDAGESPDEELEEEETGDDDPDEEPEEEAKDAGVARDASMPPSKDAGTVDAGSTKPDAGSSSDAGAKPDAGSSSDAGTKPDAGSGTSDAGAKPDASTGGNEAFLRGELLVADNACGSCHQENFAGTAFYPNITPDMATGIGGWTDAQIIAAITMGKGNDGARLCALMQRYSFTEAELADLLAYLRGIPAIDNEIDSVCPGHGK